MSSCGYVLRFRCVPVQECAAVSISFSRVFPTLKLSQRDSSSPDLCDMMLVSGIGFVVMVVVAV